MTTENVHAMLMLLGTTVMHVPMDLSNFQPVTSALQNISEKTAKVIILLNLSKRLSIFNGCTISLQYLNIYHQGLLMVFVSPKERALDLNFTFTCFTLNWMLNYLDFFGNLVKHYFT